MRIDDENISRLSQVYEDKDIKNLSNAIFPGTHCPLFGVGMIASFIEDLVVLVAGTQECTYYVKDFAYQRQKGKDNFYSIVTDKHDITFGCEDKIKEAILKIDKKHKPKAIMIVSTCVLELIGEDFEAIAASLEDEVSADILVVPTEHFKCNSHIPGMEKTLEQLIYLMDDNKKEDRCVNILGHRQHGVEETELYKVLELEGIKIQTIIPSKIKIEKLKGASKASLNLVTDFVALPLAKKMEEVFNIPYIYFEKYLSIDRIRAGYIEIEKALDIEILKHLEIQEQKLKSLILEAKEVLGGKKFIYGNTPMMAFEVSSFLVSLGLEPILIQVRELYENDSIYMDEIRDVYDPMITRIANIASIDRVYDKYRPDFYIGHENPIKLMSKGIIQVTVDEATKKLGYEIPIVALEKLINSYKDFIKNKNMMKNIFSKGEKNHGVM